MPIANGRELRAAYLEYFRTLPTHPHPIVPSAPLIPPDDPTLLFTSAGMVQFKALYSGDIDPLPYVRAATCQKCLRAGGKGSDLENVGKTLRHHTFFEMLGNFSFGDYFKKQAIEFAWEFCTSRKWMGLPAERMFPTIYGPTTEEIDREAEKFWTDLGVPNPLIPLNAAENFWGPAGDTGACGPCSEVKYFMGTDAELKEVQAMLRSGDAGVAAIGKRVVDEGDLFLEIWNMVFPQFDQQRDGSRPLLKNKGIDTGAGLERMTTALLSLRGEAYSPYETDLLAPIVNAASQALGVKYVKVLAHGGSDAETSRHRLAINAISDHVRALTFCLAEGITPSNIGRGYVVRRIQRRALRFASLLGMDRPFMADLYDSVVEAMGDTYPEIKKNPDFIRKALRIEDETFLRTRERGQRLLDELLEQAKDSGTNAISGEDAFRLWDTYGFPVDLTEEIALDAGVTMDRAGYEAVRAQQRAEAKKSFKGASAGIDADAIDAIAEEFGPTEFTGYALRPEPAGAHVQALVSEGKRVPEIAAGGKGLVFLDRSPFYAESGGQVGDTGTLHAAGLRAQITDTQKTPAGVYLHFVTVTEGTLRAGTSITAAVDNARRGAIVRHHSSVHLLQNALKHHVGDHITQAGSFVGPDACRFDFTHSEPIPREMLRKVQETVNALILDDHPVVTETLSIEEAKQKGAIAPFGEKYGAVVRVVTMGPSVEFCGGVHLERTSQAGRFRILSESSIASGVRRIEAVAGSAAVAAEAEDQYAIVGPLQSMLAVKGTETVKRVEQLAERQRELEREIAGLRRDLAMASIGDVSAKAQPLPDGFSLVALRLDGFDGAELRSVAETVRDRMGPKGVALIAGAKDDKVGLAVACGAEAAKRFPAGKAVGAIAAPLGGKGGGKPELAQAGAKDVAALDATLADAARLIAG